MSSPRTPLPLPLNPPSKAMSSTSQSLEGPSNRVDVIDTEGGRILCVADVRGQISLLNKMAKEHNAAAIIHSGDFGFIEPSSLDRISDRTLRHLIQYSALIPTTFRNHLLSLTQSSNLPQSGASNVANQIRTLLRNPPSEYYPDSVPGFALSEFPLLLEGKLRLEVPVYTVWGACEDVAILEKIRLSPPPPLYVHSIPPPPSPSGLGKSSNANTSYSIPNLTVLDEATTRVLLIGGIRLRLFGLGGAVVSHKLFDNGEGAATIAGGAGTMWTTILQIGELVDTAVRVFDPTETRLLVTHASPGREGLITQLSLVLKADLTISAGLHFRYGISYNEFSVQSDPESFRAKLDGARKSFQEVWESVKTQVELVIDDSQRNYLQNALGVTEKVPKPPPPPGTPVNAANSGEEPAWKNTWNWNLPDAAFGSLILDIRDGRIGSEMKSQGFNFAYRQNQPKPMVHQPPPSQQSPQPVQNGTNSVFTPADSSADFKKSATALDSSTEPPKPPTPGSGTSQMEGQKTPEPGSPEPSLQGRSNWRGGGGRGRGGRFGGSWRSASASESEGQPQIPSSTIKKDSTGSEIKSNPTPLTGNSRQNSVSKPAQLEKAPSDSRPTTSEGVNKEDEKIGNHLSPTKQSVDGDAEEAVTDGDNSNRSSRGRGRGGKRGSFRGERAIYVRGRGRGGRGGAPEAEN